MEGGNRRLELDLYASCVVHFWRRRGWRGCRNFGFCVGDSVSDNYSVQSHGGANAELEKAPEATSKPPQSVLIAMG
jgi:hypothetical protein